MATFILRQKNLSSIDIVNAVTCSDTLNLNNFGLEKLTAKGFYRLNGGFQSAVEQDPGTACGPELEPFL